MSNLFNRDYYEDGARLGLSLYTDYRWLPDLTVPMCEALVHHLGIKKTDRILDFGCAKGYVVKALHGLGYAAYGADISEYAISQADDETRPYLKLVDDDGCAGRWDWILAKDVLEHLTNPALTSTLAGMRGATANLFVAVPLGDGTRYVIPEMERDVTHTIRQPLWWWIGALEEAGFSVEATYEMPGIKDNWVAKYPHGNGFLVAR